MLLLALKEEEVGLISLCIISRNIYWTDWGLESIEMAEYDGANRRVIVTRTGSWINGITLDIPGLLHYIFTTEPMIRVMINSLSIKSSL